VTPNFSSPYELVKTHIGKEISMTAKIMPELEKESEMYEKEILNSEIVVFKSIKPTWDEFKEWFMTHIAGHPRIFSPIQHKRPLLLKKSRALILP